MRLPELQDDDKEAKKLKSEQVLFKGWEDIEQVLYYYGLSIVLKVIHLEYHNDPLIGHFDIEKTRELIAKNYYCPTLWRDVEAYVKG